MNCPRCTRPYDDHCWKCEPVVLCPFTDKHGNFHSPCQRVGPAHKEKSK